MMRAVQAGVGVGLLGLIWFGPLPALAQHSFAAHMTMHMGVVAVAAPLVALALAGSARDPMQCVRWPAAALAASMLELIVVWGWHAPVLHQAARLATPMLVLEQGSFLSVGLLLWLTAVGGRGDRQQAAAGAGVAALLFTSMHMTLLGALFALATRPLFQHAGVTAGAVADQQLGGAIMLIVGGTSYLIGGLWLSARLLGPLSASPQQESRR
jgi:putative membrane protein